MTTLEAEIATALNAVDATSADLGELIARVTAAAADADAEATQTRARALDPSVVVDAEAVGAAVASAELRRDRLNAALPRLQQRHAKLDAAERYARWVIDYDKIHADQETAAAELYTMYPRFVVKLTDLLYRIEALDREIAIINRTKPTDADQANGDGRFLDSVEVRARDGLRLGATSITRDLKLPHWISSDGFAWPPHRSVLQFAMTELEQSRIDSERAAVRQRARDIANTVEAALQAAE